MRQKAWPFDPRVRELLERFLSAAKRTKRPYAIGGALAMAAHGYARQTQDIDAFLQHEDRVEWFRALRAQGLTVALDLLVTGKFLSDRTRDHQDVDEMFSRGLFDPRSVAKVMRHVNRAATVAFLRKYGRQ